MQLLQLDGNFSGEDGTSGGAVDSDVARLVGLEEFPVDGHSVVNRSGKGVLGCEAIEDGNDFGAGQIGNGNGLSEGA